MIDKIKAEADAIPCGKDEKIKALEALLKLALKERDEALAYAEQLRNYIKGPGEFSKDERKAVLSEQPPAALAALKAEWQAEAIESILNLDYGYMQFEDGSFAYTEESISGYAESIRQRAQEAGDE